MISSYDVLLCYLHNLNLVSLKTSKQVAIPHPVFLFFMVLIFQHKELWALLPGRDRENQAGHPSHFTDKTAEGFIN